MQTGAIHSFYENDAPAEIRERIRKTGKHAVLTRSYPYDRMLDAKAYNDEMLALQIELVKMQSAIARARRRLCVLFEGRDASGKGGTIARFRSHLNPRIARIVALARPSDREAGMWYFQRYVAQLPAAGEISLFDRSWYNRAVVERVFGFCTEAERELFFQQVPDFEQMLVDDGIILVKIWLNVGRAEQLRRMLSRESDPLKQWKVSDIDVAGLARWDLYSRAIAETLARTHFSEAPWTVVRGDDKRRARLAAIRAVLSVVDYPGKDRNVARPPDPAICGGPEIWDA